MYSIVALIPDLSGSNPFGDRWQPVCEIEELETGQEELQEAQRQAEMAGRFYINVRILDGDGDVVQEA